LSKVILQGYIIVPDADFVKVKKGLETHINLTKQEAGCLIFNVKQDDINNNKFNVYEEFTDQQAFDNHQLRVKKSNWGKITANFKRHYRISNG
jgi:quinol monooxygenase YgiN